MTEFSNFALAVEVKWATQSKNVRGILEREPPDNSVEERKLGIRIKF